MAKKEVKKVGSLTEGKKEIIARLIEEYDIESATDIQDALADLLGGTIKGMMEAEMNEHLGYEKSQRSDSDNARNGYKSKRVRSSYGEFNIDVPQDRHSTFEPRIVGKRQKDISEIDRKIIAMYGRGMTTRQISEEIEDIYGFDVSESFVSDVTDKILPEIKEWKGFVERDKKNLIATHKGISLVTIVADSFKSAETTAKWEMELSDIAQGKSSKEEFLKDIENEIKEAVLTYSK